MSLNRPVGRCRVAVAATMLGMIPGVMPVTHAQSTDIVAVTGAASPDGNGALRFFGTPVMNDAGQIAFFSTLNGTSGGSSDDSGLFLFDGSAVNQIAREGQLAPGEEGTFTDFGQPQLNNGGQFVFNASRTDGPFFEAGVGILISNGSELTVVAGPGELTPGASGNTFASPGFPILNHPGNVAFRTTVNDASSPGRLFGGVFRSEGMDVVTIASAGGFAPDGNGRFFALNNAPAINETGQVAFLGVLEDTSGGSGDNQGILRSEGAGSASGPGLTQIARKGQGAPDGNGTFASLGGGQVGLNDAGQVAFQAGLTGTTGGFTDTSGIFRGDGVGLTQIARAGQIAPDNNGTLAAFFDPVLNNAGQAAFGGIVTGTAAPGTDNDGIFRGDGSALTQIAREGQPAPGGNGVFAGLRSGVALNDAGQAAFLGQLTGTLGGASDDTGLFLYDDTLGLLPVAREGDPFLGSTITALGFNTDIDETGAPVQNPGSGFNELGQVAYEFALADGRQGIARYTAPMVTSIGPCRRLQQQRQRRTGRFGPGLGQLGICDHAGGVRR